MELSMRRCTMDDLARLMALSFRTFTAAFGHQNKPGDITVYCAKAYGEDSLRRQLDNPESSFWFLYADGELAGYIKLNTGSAQTETAEPDALEVERIYVTAAFQGRGLGGYMIEQALKQARGMGKTCVWLGVWERNTGAIRFYEAHGFRQTGSHDFYLGEDKQTDIIMRRDIPQTV